LLAAAFPERAPDHLAAWSLGRRDRALLDLRERLFGPSLEALATCPTCGARVELAFRAGDLHAPYAEDALPALAAKDAAGHAYTVRMRPLASADLLAVESAPSRVALLERCVLAAENGRGPTAFGDLPPEVVEACALHLAAGDPQAEIAFPLACPECAAAWDAPFDITDYLWSEIDAWARRALREVHLLALAYGWSEREILRLTERRRQAYLKMVTG
jgi:hypothetical protein